MSEYPYLTVVDDGDVYISIDDVVKCMVCGEDKPGLSIDFVGEYGGKSIALICLDCVTMSINRFNAGKRDEVESGDDE